MGLSLAFFVQCRPQAPAAKDHVWATWIFSDMDGPGPVLGLWCNNPATGPTAQWSSGGGAQHGPPALNTSGCGPWISSSIGSVGSTGHCSREPCRAALWPSPPRATGPGTPPVIFLLQVRLVLPGATLPHLTIHAVHGDTGPLCHCHDCWGAAAPPVTGPSRPWPRRWRPLMGHVWHRRPGTLCTWWWGQ